MKELDRIYENCLPTYQMYVKRGDFETLGQLFQFAVEFESIQHRDRIRLQSQDCSYRSLGQAHGNTRESPKSQMPANAVQARNPFRGSPQTPSQPRPNIMPREEISNRMMNQEALPTPPESRSCFNYGSEGHFARECRNPRRLVCWDCRREGNRTTVCCRRLKSGNDQRPRPTREQLGTRVPENRE